MRFDCPHCQHVYDFDEKKIPEGGIHAKCIVCTKVFFVKAPEEALQSHETQPIASQAVSEAAPTTTHVSTSDQTKPVQSPPKRDVSTGAVRESTDVGMAALPQRGEGAIETGPVKEASESTAIVVDGYLVIDRDGKKKKYTSLSDLQLAVVHQKLLRSDKVSEDGINWKHANTVDALRPFFEVVDKASQPPTPVTVPPQEAVTKPAGDIISPEPERVVSTSPAVRPVEEANVISGAESEDKHRTKNVFDPPSRTRLPTGHEKNRARQAEIIRSAPSSNRPSMERSFSDLFEETRSGNDPVSERSSERQETTAFRGGETQAVIEHDIVNAQREASVLDQSLEEPSQEQSFDAADTELYVGGDTSFAATEISKDRSSDESLPSQTDVGFIPAESDGFDISHSELTAIGGRKSRLGWVIAALMLLLIGGGIYLSNSDRYISLFGLSADADRVSRRGTDADAKPEADNTQTKNAVQGDQPRQDVERDGGVESNDENKADALAELAQAARADAVAWDGDERLPNDAPPNSEAGPEIPAKKTIVIKKVEPENAVAPQKASTDKKPVASASSKDRQKPAADGDQRQKSTRYSVLMQRAERARLSDKTWAALELYQKAIALKGGPDARAYAGMGWCYLDLGKKLDAKSHFYDAIRVRPSFADAHFGLAEIEYQGGAPATALKHYRKYLEYAPSGDDAGIARSRIDALKKKMGES